MKLSEHHEKVNDMGIGKCSVPMFSGDGCPAGFCDKEAYGPRLPTTITRRWDGVQIAADGGYTGFVSGLACPMHSGPSIRLFMDGNMWCAVHPDFEDLQVSTAGFGETQQLAIDQLRAQGK